MKYLPRYMIICNNTTKTASFGELHIKKEREFQCNVAVGNRIARLGIYRVSLKTSVALGLV